MINGYFMVEKQALGAAREYSIDQEMRDRIREARLKWQTAYAGDEPIVRYEIWRDDQKVGQTTHTPRVDRTPFIFKDTLRDRNTHNYQILTVDAAGLVARTENILLPGV